MVWYNGCHTGRFKKGPGELSEITSNASLKAACARLEDGYRLTLWAYDKEQVSVVGCHVMVRGGGGVCNTMCDVWGLCM